MSEQDRIACIALSQVPGVGTYTARRLLAHFPHPAEIFTAPTRRLLAIEKVGTVLVNTLKAHKASLEEAKAIYDDCQAKNIEIITLLDAHYPSRLKEIEDAPAVLYSVGNANPEPIRAVSLVGTRKNTPYGKKITHEIIEGLRELDVTTVSGLAFGIDTHVHKISLAQGLPTFAVLPTPLDQVYPAQNRDLAVEIAHTGRLYSEYAPKAKVDVRNFPMRNRLIAALSHATIVIESAESGGSLITAKAAQDYNREVFAVPGRVGDETSAGCLNLISNNVAAVFTSVSAFLDAMGWQNGRSITTKSKAKPPLPSHLTQAERHLLETLTIPDGLHIDDVSIRTGIGLNILAGHLLKLEFESLVVALPGKKFRVANSLL